MAKDKITPVILRNTFATRILLSKMDRNKTKGFQLEEE